MLPNAPEISYRSLIAGRLRVDLVGADLVDITFGDTQVAQRIYVAVRDESWNTIPGTMSDLEVREAISHFAVTFTMRHRHGEVDFSWRGTIVGHADSRVEFTMDGEAHTAFRFAKIGFNIHHRLEDYLGSHFHSSGGDEETSGVFGADVEPQLLRDGVLTAMFPPFNRLHCQFRDDVAATFELNGDLFETQDHRNWADANFKTYGTPLAAGFPMDAYPGYVLHQSVTVIPQGAVPEQPEIPAHRRRAFPVSTLDFSPRPATGRLPDFGHNIGGLTVTTPTVIDRCRLLKPAHLRVDVRPAEDFEAGLEDALSLCTAVGSPVELAVYVSSDKPARGLDAVARVVVDHTDVTIARVLAFVEAVGFRDAGCTPPEVVDVVRERLASQVGQPPVVGGTDQFFAELTRTPAVVDGLDGINFALNPQVHMCDDLSLMDNTEAVRHLEHSARALGGGIPVHISTVSLLGPDGPFPAGPPAPGDPDSNVDARQGGLFCAAWTVGFATHAAHGRIVTATCFDLFGGRGVIADDSTGSRLAAAGSTAGDVFPVFHVLADLAAWIDRDVVDASPPQEERVYALFQHSSGGGARAIIANGNDRTRWVTLSGVDCDELRFRVLDKSTVETARKAWEIFRGMLPERSAVIGGCVTIALGPYAVVCAEWDQSQH